LIQTARSGQNVQNGFIALLAKCTGLEAAVLMRVSAACFFVILSEVEDLATVPAAWSKGLLDYASLHSNNT
jgi:hypothetical protein